MKFALSLAVALTVVVVVSCQGGADPAPPASATFADAKAVLDKYCLECHGDDDPGGEYIMLTHAGILKGGEKGAALVEGDAENSLMIKMVEKRAKPFMPQGRRSPKPTKAEVAILRAWIDAGAPGS